MLLNFFIPNGAPHKVGETLANEFYGARAVHHGSALADNNMHYGLLYAEGLREKCAEQGKRWIHVDHGHFKRSRDPSQATGYYRFSPESQASGFVEPTPRDTYRLEKLVKRGTILLDRPIASTESKIIAYQPPSPFMRDHFGLSHDFDAVWTRAAQQMFPENDMLIVPKGPKDGAFFDKICAFVSFNSTVAFACMERGIPVMFTAPVTWLPGNARVWSGDESVRRRVFACIAGRNWTVNEMASGEALFHMIDNGVIKRRDE